MRSVTATTAPPTTTDTNSTTMTSTKQNRRPLGPRIKPRPRTRNRKTTKNSYKVFVVFQTIGSTTTTTKIPPWRTTGVATTKIHEYKAFVAFQAIGTVATTKINPEPPTDELESDPAAAAIQSAWNTRIKEYTALRRKGYTALRETIRESLNASDRQRRKTHNMITAHFQKYIAIEVTTAKNSRTSRQNRQIARITKNINQYQTCLDSMITMTIIPEEGDTCYNTPTNHQIPHYTPTLDISALHRTPHLKEVSDPYDPLSRCSLKIAPIVSKIRHPSLQNISAHLLIYKTQV